MSSQSLSRGHGRGRRRAAIGLSAVLVMGLGLGLGLSLTLGHRAVGATPAPSSSHGSLGTGTTVADPPRASSVDALGQGGIAAEHSGTCRVPIRNAYNRYDWRAQAKCTLGGDLHSWLVTIDNPSAVPVFVNEWYGLTWHGETPILAGQAKTIPVWGRPGPQLWVGACWQGPGGPGTCQNGVPDQFASVVFEHWEQADNVSELWIRQQNDRLLPLDGKELNAQNRSQFPVQLRVELQVSGVGDWVTVPPAGVITIPAHRWRLLHGRKEFGTGEVARVLVY
jgi:hypothetical protein